MSTVADPGLLNRENPWPGLLAFSEEASEFFNGRETETAELFRLIRREQLTLLYGQSGLGKSSLLNAGLFPLLRDEDLLPVSVRIDHRPDSPSAGEQMRRRLLEECAAHGIEAPAPGEDQTLWEYLHLKDTTFWSPRNRPVTPVFVLDQFEEVFTLGRAAPQKARDMLLELGDLINNEIPGDLQTRLNAAPDEAGRYAFRRSDYRVVLSLREDFLPDLEHQLRDVVRAPTQNSVRLTRMTGQQAHDALVATGGHLLAEGVAPLIIRFLAARSDRESGEEAPLGDLEIEPALLSVFARELNERRKERGLDRIEPGLLQGSKGEILTAFYESSFEGLRPEVRVFVEEALLTESGFRDSTAVEDAARRPGVTLAALDALIDQRILRKEERFGTQRVELTHDVLTKIVRDSRDERRRREEEAEREAREAAEKRRMRKRTRQLAAVAGVFLLLALGSVGFGLQAREARDAAREAQDIAEAQADSARAAQERAEAAAIERDTALSQAQKDRERAEEQAEAAERARAQAVAARAESEERARRLEDALQRPEKLADLRDLDVAAAPTLVLGSSTEGRLTGDQLRYADRYYAVSLYKGDEGDIIRFDYQSSVFDTYLLLFDADTGERIDYDDDSLGGTNSRIEVRLPRTGTYVVAASSYSEEEVGEYLIAVSEGTEESLASTGTSGTARPQQLADLGIEGGSPPAGAPRIVRDSAHEGSLSADSDVFGGRSYDVWLYAGEADELVRIDHRSGDFDPYLYVFDLDTGELLSSDDDSGDGSNARVEAQLPGTGTYVIVASSFWTTAEGGYQISVTDGALPPGPEPGADRPLTLADLGITDGALPEGARQIGRNASVEGRLDGSSPTFSDRRYAIWTFEGEADEILRIDYRSADFDAFLYLFDLGTGELIETNDDWDDTGFDSRIQGRLLQTGTYVIVASSYGTAAEGEYQLSVADDAIPAGPNPGADRPLSLADLGITDGALPEGAEQIGRNTSVEGRLDGSSPTFSDRRYTIWTFEGHADEILRIDHRSADFDAFLYLFDLGTGDLIDFSDDGEDTGFDSRIEARLPHTGTFLIVPSTYEAMAEGSYELETHVVNASRIE